MTDASDQSGTPVPEQPRARARGGRAKTPNSRPTPLGIYDKARSEGVTGIEITAVVLSVLWLLGCLIFFVFLPQAPTPEGQGGLRFLMTMLAIFMPVAMIWVAATAARASRVMREESQRLQAEVQIWPHRLRATT